MARKEAKPDATGRRFAIVVARFNEAVTERLGSDAGLIGQKEYSALNHR
jgi:6,7-dimethyl-8-ribityllumazine synthase